MWDEFINAEDQAAYVAGLSAGQLTELYDQVKVKAQELHDQIPTADDPTVIVTDLEELSRLAGLIKTEQSSRAEATATASEKAATAMAVFDDPDPKDDDDDDEDEPAPEPEPEAAVKASLSDAARRRPRQTEPKQTAPAFIVASAGPGEDDYGAAFGNRDEVMAAIFNRAHRGPDGEFAVVRTPVASRNKYQLGRDELANQVTIDRLQVDYEEQLRSGADLAELTAAGFCAPAQPIYDYFGASSATAGILQLPSLGAPRGRVNVAEAVSPAALTDQAIGYKHTAALDELATPKPCYTVACGDSNLFSVAGFVTCLTFSNFDSQFYPERVAYITRQALIRHAHDVNADRISNILLDPATTFVADSMQLGGTVVGLLRSLNNAAGYYRTRHKMAQNAVLEAVIPYWVRTSFAADAVARASTTDYAAAAAQIDAAVRALAINPQWVYDWQEPAVAGQFDGFFSYLLFAAGTVVDLNGGSLDQGVTRDSALNLANDFQYFTEEFIGQAVVGYEVLHVTGVEGCPNGVTGGTGTLTCPGS